MTASEQWAAWLASGGNPYTIITAFWTPVFIAAGAVRLLTVVFRPREKGV